MLMLRKTQLKTPLAFFFRFLEKITAMMPLMAARKREFVPLKGEELINQHRDVYLRHKILNNNNRLMIR